MKNQPTEKTCPHCTRLGLGPQPVARFSRNACREDGLQDQCRAAAGELYRKRTYGDKRKRGRSKDLEGILNRFAQPRYDNLIRAMLETALKNHDNPARWLGMKAGTFQVFLVKFKVRG